MQVIYSSCAVRYQMTQGPVPAHGPEVGESWAESMLDNAVQNVTGQDRLERASPLPVGHRCVAVPLAENIWRSWLVESAVSVAQKRLRCCFQGRGWRAAPRRRKENHRNGRQENERSFTNAKNIVRERKKYREGTQKLLQGNAKMQTLNLYQWDPSSAPWNIACSCFLKSKNFIYFDVKSQEIQI